MSSKFPEGLKIVIFGYFFGVFLFRLGFYRVFLVILNRIKSADSLGPLVRSTQAG
jgi:hypothetical protein